MLGAPLDDISIYIGDSALNPPAGGTFATRQLYMSGNAVLQAARELRDRMAPVAADLLGVPPGRARVRRRPGLAGRGGGTRLPMAMRPGRTGAARPAA